MRVGWRSRWHVEGRHLRMGSHRGGDADHRVGRDALPLRDPQHQQAVLFQQRDPEWHVRQQLEPQLHLVRFRLRQLHDDPQDRWGGLRQDAHRLLRVDQPQLRVQRGAHRHHAHAPVTRQRKKKTTQTGVWRPRTFRTVCPGPESNQRHGDFQSPALPTELPGRASRPLEARGDLRCLGPGVKWLLLAPLLPVPRAPPLSRSSAPRRRNPVSWLNYHHLLYFWTVARAGSIAKASQELRLAQPTISAQLKLLEDSLGHKLLERQGRRLVLTDVGRTVLRYADDIFRLGNELTHAINGLPSGQRLRFAVGVTDVVPKLVAESLLHPAFDAFPHIHITCREGPLPQLLASLALHELDVVLSDTPSSEPVSVRSFNHLLGTCGVSFFAAPRLAHLARGFPKSLDGAPMLLPSEGSSAPRALPAWFDAQGVRPLVVGGFDDSALLNAFGQRGHGVFAAPSVIEAEVCRQFSVSVLGRTGDIETGFYAISVERRLRHPAVVAIAERARSHLFG